MSNEIVTYYRNGVGRLVLMQLIIIKSAVFNFSNNLNEVKIEVEKKIRLR